MGYRPTANLAGRLADGRAVYIAAADPAGDDPMLAEALRKSGFIIVQELFMTATARMADLILPVQAFTEREGSFINGERRIQRYYPAIKASAGSSPDYQVTARIAQLCGFNLEERHASLVFKNMAESLPDLAGLSYIDLAKVVDQWPVVGRSDLYFGGTGYDNHQGLGVQLKPSAQRLEPLHLPDVPSLNPCRQALTCCWLCRLPACMTAARPSCRRPCCTSAWKNLPFTFIRTWRQKWAWRIAGVIRWS